MEAEEIIKKLKSFSNKKNREGMARFGINTEKAFGISIPVLRDMAKQIGKDHALALELWASGYHEARLLSALIDEPGSVSEMQMENWAKDFNSWDLCDQCCSNLFDKTPYAYSKAFEWSTRDEEFVKRAGFAMMAVLAVHDKKADDSVFLEFLPVIERNATDERNFVKKAVNWALRQIGKRNSELCGNAIRTAAEIYKINSKSAKWIATDALRELRNKTYIMRSKEKHR